MCRGKNKQTNKTRQNKTLGHHFNSTYFAQTEHTATYNQWKCLYDCSIFLYVVLTESCGPSVVAGS